MRDCTFAEIAAVDPPAAFSNLFAADVGNLLFTLTKSETQYEHGNCQKSQLKTKQAEADRLAARREVRVRIAEREQLLSRAAIEQKRLAALDAEADEAVAEHRSDVRADPSRAGDNREPQYPPLLPTGSRLTPRSSPAVASCSMNWMLRTSSLSDQVERFRRLRAPLLKAIRELQSEAGQLAAAENELAREPLANPALEAKSFTAKQAAIWAEKRHAAAEAHIAKCETEIQSAVPAKKLDRARPVAIARPKMAERVDGRGGSPGCCKKGSRRSPQGRRQRMMCKPPAVARARSFRTRGGGGGGENYGSTRTICRTRFA